MCDASDVGFGGYIEFSPSHDKESFGHVFGSWTLHESQQSSTWRELEAVNRVLKSNISCLQNEKVRVISDNKNVSKILHIGSKKPYLQSIACDIEDSCSKFDIKIHGLWRPRNENKKADYLSRINDRDDWEVSDQVYQYYEQLWGLHTVDRFATHYNNKCARFNSKYWCPGTEGIDAFDQCWSNENNWIVPPPSLIPRVINKILREKASSTLIVPEWKSSPYWPLLLDGEHFKSFILHWSYLPNEKIITHGKSKKSVFADFPRKFKILALRIDFE